MKLRTTRHILPYLLFYTDNLQDWQAGAANGPVVRIRPKYRDDAGLHRHEAEHVWQWYVTLGTIGFFYKLSRRVRQWSEAQAFGAQMASGVNMEKLAARLAGDRYDLGITHDEARLLIVKAQ